MPSCALRYCKSRYGKTTDRDFSLFSFPPVADVAREKWIRFVQKERREENWLPSSASKLCSKHFRKENVYLGKTGRKILKKGSLPHKTTENDETGVEAIRSSTPISVDVSDSDSIFDTPRIIALKAQVHKLQKQKIRHRDKIRKLCQQNKYLKRKILNLKSFVHFLEKKIKEIQIMYQTVKSITETEAVYDGLNKKNRQRRD